MAGLLYMANQKSKMALADDGQVPMKRVEIAFADELKDG